MDFDDQDSAHCLDLGQDDEVIVPTNISTTTARAALSAGAKPVLCDIAYIPYNGRVE